MTEIKSKKIEIIDIEKIVPNPRNANDHSEKQVDIIVKLIKHQGFRNPLTISNRSGFLVCGHGRLIAALKLEMKQLPVIYQDYANEAEEFQHMISDNKVAELADHNDLKMIEGIKDLGLEKVDFELLGLVDFFLPSEKFEMEEELKEDMNKKYIIEVTFPNDMEMMDIHDDLVSRGYIVKIK